MCMMMSRQFVTTQRLVNLLGDNGFVCFLYGYVLFPGTDYGCWYMLPFCMVHRREYILDLIFQYFLWLFYATFSYPMVYIWQTGGTLMILDVEMLQQCDTTRNGQQRQSRLPVVVKCQGCLVLSVCDFVSFMVAFHSLPFLFTSVNRAFLFSILVGFTVHDACLFVSSITFGGFQQSTLLFLCVVLHCIEQLTRVIRQESCWLVFDKEGPQDAGVGSRCIWAFFGHYLGGVGQFCPVL